jgi:hypothetical protein
LDLRLPWVPTNVKILLRRFNVKIIRKGPAKVSFNSR